MMVYEQDKQRLIEEIDQYVPMDGTELGHKQNLLAFLRESDNNFERSNLQGHVTGSAWLLNSTRSRVLLMHHRKLTMWMQLGGHADGDSDILAVALREAQEESGLKDIFPIQTSIFDIDVHMIPANATKGEPQHYHYDIRYLLWTPDEQYVMNGESIDLRWVGIDEVNGYVHSESIMRMVKKWRMIVDAPG